MRCPRCETQKQPATVHIPGSTLDLEDSWAQAICQRCRNELKQNRPAEIVLPPANIPDSQQSVTAARAVARAWRQVHQGGGDTSQMSPAESNADEVIVRIDSGHRAHRRTNQPDGRAETQSAANKKITRRNTPPFYASIRGAIAFGLFLFLVGEGLRIYGFLAGHVALWSIGKLVAIGGVCFSLLSISEAFGRQQDQIRRLLNRDKSSGNSHPPQLITPPQSGSKRGRKQKRSGTGGQQNFS